MNRGQSESLNQKVAVGRSQWQVTYKAKVPKEKKRAGLMVGSGYHQIISELMGVQSSWAAGK